MATRLFDNPFVEVNSVDLSDYVQAAGFDLDTSTVRKTGAGDEWESAYINKKSGTFTVEFKQDYDAAKVNSTLFPLHGTRTAIEFRPDDAAVSATNPKTTFHCNVTALSFGGTIEEEERVRFTWPIDGEVTQATS